MRKWHFGDLEPSVGAEDANSGARQRADAISQRYTQLGRQAGRPGVSGRHPDQFVADDSTAPVALGIDDREQVLKIGVRTEHKYSTIGKRQQISGHGPLTRRGSG